MRVGVDMKKKIGDLTLREIEYIKTKQCVEVYGSCKNCPIDSIDYCNFDFDFDLDKKIEVEENE